LGNSITGVPLLGTAADLISGALPPKDPRQTALEEFYNLDDIGRVAEGELMAGYNPVSGNPLDPNYGLQEAYQERIDTIEKTLADKYPDGDYSDTELDERLAALKEAKAKEKERLDLFSGDIQPDATDLDIATGVLTGDAAVAEDAQDLNLMDVRDEMADIETGDASLAERIAAENRAAAEEAQRIENERAANARENARAEAAREAAAQAEAEARAVAREKARQPAPTYTPPSPHYDRPSGDNQGGNTGSGGHRSPGGSGYGPHSR